MINEITDLIYKCPEGAAFSAGVATGVIIDGVSNLGEKLTTNLDYDPQESGMIAKYISGVLGAAPIALKPFLKYIPDKLAVYGVMFTSGIVAEHAVKEFLRRPDCDTTEEIYNQTVNGD